MNGRSKKILDPRYWNEDQKNFGNAMIEEMLRSADSKPKLKKKEPE